MKYFLLLAFALSLSFMFAQSPSDYPHHFNYGDAPVAATDDYLSPMVNPAAMGRGNSGGISFMQLYMDKKYQNPYTVFLNMDNLAYVIQKENNHLNYHTLATGGKVVLGQTIPNLYLGMGYDWRNEYIKKGDIRSSLLWAPHNALSLGFVLTNPFQKAPVYRIGAGVRPLFLGGKVSNRFEMTADMNYAMKTDGDRGLLKPILGVNSEVIDGLKLGGSYNMESKTYGITFSLYNGKSAVGTRAHIKNTDENPGDVNYMYDYVTASDKMFRSILNGKDKAGYYEMPIKQSIVDEKKGMKIGPFFIVDGKQTAMYDLLKKVKQMEEEPTVGGIVFRNINFAASFAHREELIDALKEFKSKGKTIVFYFDNISNGNYAFAAAVGDKIYMNPLGTIDLRGIALNNPYFKELADTLGVDFISYQSHKYKSAFNMFTEKQMTPEERIALSSFLDDLYKEYVNMIQSGRGDKLHKPVQQVIDEGPYFDPDQCLELGLVDQLIYEDQLTDVLKKDMSLKHKITKIEPKYQYDWSEKPKTNVALIYATGNILMGKSAPGKTIGSKTLSELIAKARKQPDIKGIILRVDSGGGSAQASDIIANEVKLCNTGKHPKPIVVSMAGAAASGGYYISTFANKIVAEPSTLTGSIGVTGLGVHAERLFKKLHINWSEIKYGEHSDLGSLSRKPTEEETEMMRSMTETFYKKFVTVCATGRKMPYEDIDKIAQGRVWTGNQAIKNGLIDELGGLNKAVEVMKQEAKIKGDINLVEYQTNTNSLEIAIGFGAQTLSQSSQLPAELGILQDIVQTWNQYKDEKCLMLTPFDLTQWDK